MAFAIGLTGGAGSGKSTVAQYFKELGIDVFSADVIARTLTQKNTDAFAQIVEHFGDKILTATGDINRPQLRSIICNNKDERLWLNQLLHPKIREKLKAEITASKTPYCIVEIPLLVENKANQIVDRVLVIDCDANTQVNRLKKRDRQTDAEAKQLINTQALPQSRLNLADDVIKNDKDFTHLKKAVGTLHITYQNLATS